MANDEEKTWLVKSGDRIVGPYAFEMLVKKLQAREVVVIDEVAMPNGRWRYIREEPAFRAAVEEIWRQSQGLREDTDVATVSTTGSDTFDLLRSQTTPPPPERVHAPIPPPSEHHSRSLVKRPKIDMLQAGETEPIKLRRPSRWPWAIAAIAVGFAGVMFVRMASQVNARPGSSFAQISADAARAEKVGDFTEALKLYREAHILKPGDPDISLHLAACDLRVEKQTVLAKRLSEEVLASVHDDDHVSRGKTIQAVAAIEEGDLDEAHRLLKEVTASRSDFVPALFNLGVVNFLQKNYSEARETFEHLLAADAGNSTARYMLARSEMMTDHSAALKTFMPLKKINGEFAQEAWLTVAYLQSLDSGDEKALIDTSKQILRTDPFATGEYWRDPLMYIDILGWKDLQTYCESIEKNHDKSVYIKALSAICFVKVSRNADALKVMIDVLAIAPNDPILLSANAGLLLDFGKDQEAKGSLRLAMRDTDDEGAVYLMARACAESQDELCEREHWKKVLSKDRSSIAALTGLAALEFRSGSKEDARKYLDQAKVLSRTYIPLLRLEDQLEHEGQ